MSPSAASSSSILSGQSAPVMSQNLHSAELGTRAAGLLELLSPGRVFGVSATHVADVAGLLSRRGSETEGTTSSYVS